MFIVEERRNVLRRKNTPAIRRNTRKGNRARICFYIRIFLKNFSSKPFSMIDCRLKGVIIPAPHTVSHSLYKISFVRRSIRNINITPPPPPPGKPRPFEYFLCPGSREFDLKRPSRGGEFDFAWVWWGI